MPTLTERAILAGGRNLGRPPIGPKMQGAVPPEVYAAVEQEARRREVQMAIIWREMAIAAFNAGFHLPISELEA